MDAAVSLALRADPLVAETTPPLLIAGVHASPLSEPITAVSPAAAPLVNEITPLVVIDAPQTVRSGLVIVHAVALAGVLLPSNWQMYSEGAVLITKGAHWLSINGTFA